MLLRTKNTLTDKDSGRTMAETTQGTFVRGLKVWFCVHGGGGVGVLFFFLLVNLFHSAHVDGALGSVHVYGHYCCVNSNGAPDVWGAALSYVPPCTLSGRFVCRAHGSRILCLYPYPLHPAQSALQFLSPISRPEKKTLDFGGGKARRRHEVRTSDPP